MQATLAQIKRLLEATNTEFDSEKHMKEQLILHVESYDIVADIRQTQISYIDEIMKNPNKDTRFILEEYPYYDHSDLKSFKKVHIHVKDLIAHTEKNYARYNPRFVVEKHNTLILIISPPEQEL